MVSENSGTATETKGHPGAQLRLVADRDPPKPFGDLEQYCRQNPRKSQALEHSTTLGTVLE